VKLNTYAIINLTDFSAAFNGEHIYSSVTIFVANDRIGSIDVTNDLSKRAAAKLNKKDGSNCWEEGDHCARFDSKDDAVNKSIEVLSNKYPFIKYAFSDTLSNPVECFLAPDKETKENINSLHEEWDSFYEKTNDPWADGNGEAIDLVYEKWEKLLLSIKESK